MTTPTATPPNFGTPAIEKSQAELAHSPAQRLLAESASSTSAATPPLSAEAALLGAAAAGVTSVGKVENEIEEPATLPVDEAVEKDLQAGAGIPTNVRGTSGNEILTATPLDNENEVRGELAFHHLGFGVLVRAEDCWSLTMRVLSPLRTVVRPAVPPDPVRLARLLLGRRPRRRFGRRDSHDCSRTRRERLWRARAGHDPAHGSGH